MPDNETLFHFDGADALARWSIGFMPIVAGGVVGLWLYDLWAWRGLVGCGVVACIAAAGLRASITITRTQAVVRKTWLSIPYRTYRAPSITDVYFSGDWRMASDATGLVVVLGESEVHIGSRATMGRLYTALLPHVVPGIVSPGVDPADGATASDMAGRRDRA